MIKKCFCCGKSFNARLNKRKYCSVKCSCNTNAKIAGQRLMNWKEKNHDLMIVACQKGAITMRKKHPNLVTNKLSCEMASKMGKISQQKHPETSKNLGQWVKNHPEHSSTVAKETHRKYPNLAHQLGKIVSEKYPGAGKIRAKTTMTKYPELLKTMGILSAEIQAQHGFVSKVEKQMKEWLPNDFIHGKRIGKFVPDFHSPLRKIIIEVDGVYWHNLPHIVVKDNFKKEYFSNLGYKIYRFTDKDIIKEPEKVKAKLKIILKQ